MGSRFLEGGLDDDAVQELMACVMLLGEESKWLARLQHLGGQLARGGLGSYLDHVSGVSVWITLGLVVVVLECPGIACLSIVVIHLYLRSFKLIRN